MSNTKITPEDVIASNEKNPGSVLTWNPDKFRDNKKQNKQAQFDVTWVNIQFVTASGKKVPCHLKFNNAVLGSGAKAPQTKDDGDISNYSIQFKKFIRSEIEGGDYIPKVRSTPEAQTIENKAVSEKIDEYMENNAKLIQALDIIQISFSKVAKEIIEADKAKKLKFTVKKDRKIKDTPICTIKQSMRYDEEKKEEVPLDAAIFRIKLPVYTKDGRIGQWDKFKDEFRSIVFDVRRMNEKNHYKDVPAYVKEGKNKIHLNRKNVQSFITYKSLITGSIKFESATVSKAGISLGNKFHDMYIIRHRSSNSQETFTVNEITNMRAGMASDDEESDDEINIKDNVENSGNHTDDDNENQSAPVIEDDGNATSDGEELDGDDGDDVNPEPVSESLIDKPKRIRKDGKKVKNDDVVS
jgi:hypothetical protein